MQNWLNTEDVHHRVPATWGDPAIPHKPIGVQKLLLVISRFFYTGFQFYSSWQLGNRWSGELYSLSDPYVCRHQWCGNPNPDSRLWSNSDSDSNSSCLGLDPDLRCPDLHLYIDAIYLVCNILLFLSQGNVLLVYSGIKCLLFDSKWHVNDIAVFIHEINWAKYQQQLRLALPLEAGGY